MTVPAVPGIEPPLRLAKILQTVYTGQQQVVHLPGTLKPFRNEAHNRVFGRERYHEVFDDESFDYLLIQLVRFPAC